MGQWRTRAARRPWLLLIIGVVVAAAVAIGTKAGFDRLYIWRVGAERATWRADQWPGEGHAAILNLPAWAPLWLVRLRMSPYGPLVEEPTGLTTVARYACGQSPLGRQWGWRATFNFERGELVSTRFVVLDNPVLVRWDGLGDGLNTARWVGETVLLVAAGTALLMAGLAWRYRQPLGRAAVAAAAVGTVLAVLSDGPTETFRSTDWMVAHWPAWAWPATSIGVGLAVALWPGRRHHRRGTCRACGYDLTGNASGVCPECGTPVPVRPDVSSAPAAAALAELLGTSDNAEGQ